MPVVNFHQLAEELANRRYGMTVREMRHLTQNAQGNTVCKRTIIRWLDDIRNEYPHATLHCEPDAASRQVRYFLHRGRAANRGGPGRLQSFTTRDLAIIDSVISHLERLNMMPKFRGLQRVRDKMHGLLNEREWEDYEQRAPRIRRAAAWAPGVRQVSTVPEGVELAIQEAIEGRRVIGYKHADRHAQQHMAPAGFFYDVDGPRLAGWRPSDVGGHLVTPRLEEISDVEIQLDAFEPPHNFVLQEAINALYAETGSEVKRVQLLFSSDVTDDAQRWSVQRQFEWRSLPNGDLEVTLLTRDLPGLCDQLFRWGSNVEIITPTDLKDIYHSLLEDALRSLDDEAA